MDLPEPGKVPSLKQLRGFVEALTADSVAKHKANADKVQTSVATLLRSADETSASSKSKLEEVRANITVFDTSDLGDIMPKLQEYCTTAAKVYPLITALETEYNVLITSVAGVENKVDHATFLDKMQDMQSVVANVAACEALASGEVAAAKTTLQHLSKKKLNDRCDPHIIAMLIDFIKSE